jgi:benzoyl-CoA 2,3-dioxygenase component B
MFVGETGIGRVVQRSAELTKASKNGDAREQGGIDLATIQKYLNFWYSCSLDLFGGEISTNAASFFGAGLKGRAKEEKFEDHLALEGSRAMEVPEDGKIVTRDVPLRTAMNEVLRDSYVDDCQRGVDRWNKTLDAQGLAFRFTLPSRRFHRAQGIFTGLDFDVQGNPISREEWVRRAGEWLPTEADRTYVKSLQQRAVVKPGEMAHWIAPPAKGINGLPLDYQYVRTDQ